MNKKAVIKTMNELPDEFKLDELIEKLILIEKIQMGRQDRSNGNIISNDEVKVRLGKWLK